MATVASVIADFSGLSTADKEYVKRILISNPLNINMEKLLTNERFANGRVCPNCCCTHISRYGLTPKGKQRYLCNGCKKTFVITTNSIASGTRKSFNVWERFVECMINGFSVRKSADICGIHRNTALIWRYKILDTLQKMANSVTLNGIIEADETFFPLMN